MTEPVADGSENFSYGQDAYHNPDDIRPDQYAKGVNVSTRGGKLRPRDGFQQLDLIFADDFVETGFKYTRPIANIFLTGKFQALAPYYVAPEYYLIVVISGLIFRINTRTLSTVLLSKDVRVNQFAQRINWSNAGRFLVIFDFPDFPVIIEGDEVRRADPDHMVGSNRQPEVPVSNLGTFNQNRLFVANAGNEFTGGDPVGSLATPEAPITFTEVLEPAQAFTGQTFSLGTASSDEPITAMGFLQVIDQSTGFGPLWVATENSFYTFRTDLPRVQWDQVPFGVLALYNAGVAGTRAAVNVNSDLIFLSAEGKVHALSTSRNDSQRWGNIPISREVENWIKFNDPTLRQFAVLGYFDNRVYITVNPYRAEALTVNQQPISDYAHGGFVILELDAVASLLQDRVPTWAGLWTGVNPMDMTVQNKRGFIISKDGGNKLYEIRPDRTFDTLENDKERLVRSIVYTKEYNFQTPFVNKYLQSVNIPFKNVTGDFGVRAEVKPSHSDRFLHLKNWRHVAPSVQCGVPRFPNGLAPHNFRSIVLGANESDACDPVTGDYYGSFRKEQLKLYISGKYWELEEVRLRATMEKDWETATPCEELPIVEVPLQCDDDWVTPPPTNCKDKI